MNKKLLLSKEDASLETANPKSCYVCANCGNGLEYQEKGYICQSCLSRFPISNGLPVFAKDKDFYYGEVPKDIFCSLVEKSIETSPTVALNSFLADDKITTFAYKYASDINRGNFVVLLKPGKGKRVLDLGCGWGNVSLTLARTYEECYSMDLTKERALYLKLRAKELNLDNITCLSGGDLKFLPFEDNFFDCVVMNGVLEWVPESYGSDDPEKIQVNYLKEVHRILKSDGQVYIAIENRFALEYFQGQPEDHTGMLYTSLMPRFLANAYSKRKRGKEYRTYTYSKIGYRKILRKAGFNQSLFHIPYPNYRWFDVIFTSGNIRNFISYIKRKAYKPSWKTYLKANLMSFMNHSYSIVANKKKTKQKSWLELLCKYVELNYNGKYGAFEPPEIVTTATSGIGLFFKNSKSNGLYVGIPVDGASSKNHENASQNISYIYDICNDEKILDMVPGFLKKDECQGFTIYIYELIDTTDIHIKPSKESSVIKLCSFFSSKFTDEFQITDALHPENIIDCIELYNIKIDKKQFLTSYKRMIQTAGPLLHPAHGDLWPENILTDKSGDCFFIDWTDFKNNSLPLTDLFHFFLYPHSIDNGLWMDMIDKSLNRFSKEIEAELSSAIRSVYSSWSPGYFSVERLSSLYLLYILENLVKRIKHGQNHKSTLNKIIEMTIEGPSPLPAFKHLSV